MNRLLLPIRWLGRFLRGLRRAALDLLTLTVLVIGAIAVFVALHRPGVPGAAVLRVAPHGRLVYSYSEPRWSRALNRALGNPSAQVRIRDLTTAIDRAAHDPKIKVLALDLRNFQGGSLPGVRSVARAVARFRHAGKPVYAYASSYSQGDYLIAASATRIFLNPMGAVVIAGYSDEQLYFKKLLERVGVRVYAFRVGKYKSAVEPLIRANMSAAADAENRAWLRTWWSTYRQAVATTRGITPAQVEYYANHLSALLTQAHGDAATLALQQGLVSTLADYDSFRRALARTVTGRPAAQFPEIGYRRYLAATRPAPTGAIAIAVVPIDGMLLSGASAVPGAVAAGPTVEQLDRLRHDKNVRAVVLQVNSPGGSVYAADAIRRAVVHLRRAGKPVVVSMGTLGASGAYWLSTAAQKIYAHRTTITADIGVFALYPDFSRTLAKLGIGVSDVATTPTAGALSPFRPIRPEVAKELQASVGHIYRRFVGLVARARGLSPAEVDSAAQGRAWSGADALRLRLIDQIGGIRQAIGSAAHLADLKPGSYHVDYLPRAGSPGVSQSLTPELTQALFRRSGENPFDVLRTVSAPLNPVARRLHDLAILLRTRPYGLFAYSLIVPP
ncbi:MAG: signal peptide peptidase SppA [Gammaproteobacteria bacterium]